MDRTTPQPPRPGGFSETDPFLALRRGMDRLFEQVTGGFGLPAPFAAGVTVPKVDIAEGPSGFEVICELPGIAPEDVAIELDQGVLTIRAERKQERREEDKERRWHVVERATGTFLRRFALPYEPEAETVEARFDKGVLHVTIPRPAEPKPQSRRIEIKGG